MPSFLMWPWFSIKIWYHHYQKGPVCWTKEEILTAEVLLVGREGMASFIVPPWVRVNDVESILRFLVTGNESWVSSSNRAWSLTGMTTSLGALWLLLLDNEGWKVIVLAAPTWQNPTNKQNPTTIAAGSVTTTFFLIFFSVDAINCRLSN